MTSRRFPLTMRMLATAALGILSSCSFAGDEDNVRVTVIEDGIADIKPVGIALNYASATTRAAIAKGLVGLDEQGRVVPAIAARWIVTDDGLSYIFRLNEGRWDDGRQITAERVAKLLNERVAELGNSRLGDDLKVIDEILSMTGRVIEIQLTAPNPNFLQLLAQPELGLFRVGHGAGPMRILEDGAIYTLGLLPEFTPDDEGEPADEANSESDPEDDPRRVRVRSERAAKAIARYLSGHTDLVLHGKFHHLPLLDEAGISTNDLRLDPVAGLFGFRFLRGEGFWSVPKNREILSMAIDRPALLTSFPKVTAWQSRQKIIPEALDVEEINARPDWSGMPLPDRRVFAQEHVRRWIASEGPIKPLVIALPDAAGADILFHRVRSDMQRVGLNARKANAPDDADVELIDMIAPYDSARWFLAQFSCRATPVCLNDADDLLAEADAATNLEIKARLYAQTEQILVQHYNYIPLGVPVRWSIARPNQRGFAVNPRGWHPLNPLVGVPIS